MSTTIQIPEPLLRYSNGETSVQVSGDSLLEAFEELFAIHPGLRPRVIDRNGHVMPYLILLLGRRQIQRDAWKDEKLTSGDTIEIVPAVEGGSGPLKDDVRMRGFRERVTFEVARDLALSDLGPATETVGFEGELEGRVLSQDITSQVDVPAFDRSAMDGYALRAADSLGATTYDPIELKLIGESMPGKTDLPHVGPGQACRIMTGACMPEGADAVIMAEDCAEQPGRVQISAAVSPAKHVGHRGEDIRSGGTVLRQGRCLRPQDVGLLASIGHAAIEVYGRPRVVILVTGNELLAPGHSPRQGFIVDSNSPMLAALVRRDGGDLQAVQHLADDRDRIAEFLGSLDCDVLLCAGGSSVGREDYLPQLVAELGQLQVHGVAMRPSSPTGIGRIGSAKVFLLPGNPVSCLCAYDLFASPALAQLGGRAQFAAYGVRSMRLSRRVASQIGRLDYVRMAEQEDGSVQPIALSGASLLSSTTRALGFALIPAESEGIDEGESIDVHLYDQGHAQARLG